ncbi:MAG: DUF4129 domain-containing protein [Micromonosporaceae bacterium]
MPTTHRPPRLGPLLAAGLLLGLVVLLAAVTDPQVSRVPRPAIDQGPDEGRPQPSEVVSPQETPPVDPDSWGGLTQLLATVLAALVVVALIAVLGTLLWRELRDRVSLRPRIRQPDEQELAARHKAEVKAAVEAGLEELAATGNDPRSAVIACWLRLEKAAAAAGTQRAPSDTPGDLVARMLAAHDVSAPVLGELAAAYRLARYAPYEVGEPMREQAQAALRQVHAELSRPRPQVPAGAVDQPPGEAP